MMRLHGWPPRYTSHRAAALCATELLSCSAPTMGAAASKSIEERIRERAAAAHRPTLLEKLTTTYAGWAGVIGAAVALAMAVAQLRRRNKALKSAPNDSEVQQQQGPPVWPTKLAEVTCSWLDTVVPGAPAAGGVRAFESAPLEQSEEAATEAVELTLSYGAADSAAAVLPALDITTSADLSLDVRFDVIVNSVSPEFKSSSSDSGINFAVWRTLSGYSGEGDEPPPVAYPQEPFAKRHGAAPTYGDVLWSAVPSGTASNGSALKYIVHALAPDLSTRPKRLSSGLSKTEAFATLVAVYFRSMWQATVIAGPTCRVGMPPLGAGVFANEAADIRRAAVLAHAAYRLTGGTASVSIALWSPDGEPPQETQDWQYAVSAGPAADDASAVDSALLLALLTPDGKGMLLGGVPAAHTTDEMTKLLEDSNDPQAAEFLSARADKDNGNQKALKTQLADGTTWAPLLNKLAAQVREPDSDGPFRYSEWEGASSLLGFMCTDAFLHLDRIAWAKPPPVAPQYSSVVLRFTPNEDADVALGTSANAGKW
jgi:hypothetical protein